jgi:hypothetical protein
VRRNSTTLQIHQRPTTVAVDLRFFARPAFGEFINRIRPRNRPKVALDFGPGKVDRELSALFNQLDDASPKADCKFEVA